MQTQFLHGCDAGNASSEFLRGWNEESFTRGGRKKIFLAMRNRQKTRGRLLWIYVVSVRIYCGLSCTDTMVSSQLVPLRPCKPDTQQPPNEPRRVLHRSLPCREDIHTTLNIQSRQMVFPWPRVRNLLFHAQNNTRS